MSGKASLSEARSELMQVSGLEGELEWEWEFRQAFESGWALVPG